jgi:hypothetical protein
MIAAAISFLLRNLPAVLFVIALGALGDKSSSCRSV